MPGASTASTSSTLRAGPKSSWSGQNPAKLSDAVFRLRDMTLRRMDHVAVVVEDLEAATASFPEFGTDLEGEAPVEGRWVDRVVLHGPGGPRVPARQQRPQFQPIVEGR